MYSFSSIGGNVESDDTSDEAAGEGIGFEIESLLLFITMLSE